jgi:Zn-dependent peptidase ImmA (M78 family)
VRRLDWRSRVTLRLWFALSLVFIIQSAAGGDRSEINTKRIKDVVDEMKKRLGLSQEIEAVVVAQNDLLVSVEPVQYHKGVFQMSFEAAFLNTLDDSDLRAVVAHELGHVWIFTHHPYLQTEDLANSVAYRVVSTNAMDRIYEKVRLRQRIDSRLQAKVTELLHH